MYFFSKRLLSLFSYAFCAVLYSMEWKISLDMAKYRSILESPTQKKTKGIEWHWNINCQSM
uniref:Peptidyl-prolyl cis-trans isomerase FKBP53 isoform X3 n=1 Tax=Rhizophora mucronata TaxID=61149 RepID=A0A2P2J6F7_RHIMU